MTYYHLNQKILIAILTASLFLIFILFSSFYRFLFLIVFSFIWVYIFYLTFQKKYVYRKRVNLSGKKLINKVISLISPVYNYEYYYKQSSNSVFLFIKSNKLNKHMNKIFITIQIKSERGEIIIIQKSDIYKKDADNLIGIIDNNLH